jgi:hypothetical protein
MLQAGRSRFLSTRKLLDFLSLPNLSSRNLALVSTQPLTEIGTSKLSEGKGLSA